MREVLNAIFYLNRSGCQWDMLPHDLPAKSTVYDYFAQWQDDGTWQAILDALRQQVRVAGRPTSPTPAPAASTARRSRRPRSPSERGYDGGKKITGRKRHIIVDTLGLLLVVVVSVASADDGTFAPEVLGRLTAEHRSRLKSVWADGKYHNHRLDGWLAEARRPGTDRGGRPPGRERRVREAAAALGGGADVRLAGAVPAAQPGLRAVHASRARR